MSQIIINEIAMEIVRKNIKHLRLMVQEKGEVKISAPLRMSIETVRSFIISKLPWIKKHQTKLLSQVRKSLYEYVSGEHHDYQGQTYLLQVTPYQGKDQVIVHPEGILELRAQSDSCLKDRQQVMINWYQQQLRQQLAWLIPKWEATIGVKALEWKIRSMKTRWGSCNTTVRRICLNLELIKKPLFCLEYVIVHEMVHLLEPSHNHRFKSLMDRFMPKWREYKDELNQKEKVSLV